MSIFAQTDRINDLVSQIQKLTEEYKRSANKLCIQISEVERERMQIVNLIEEAEHQGLDRRVASRLEDKLSRPYAAKLVN
jgi:hypothetical protein